MPPDDNKDQNKDQNNNDSVSKSDFEKLQADHKALMEKFEAMSKKKPEDEDPELRDKAKKEREERDKKVADTKTLESAVKFNLTTEAFLKDNASLLPKEVQDIFKTANTEKYDSEAEKANAIKAAIAQEFFSVQANLDLLTQTQKSALEDFLKLTKNGKQEKAGGIWDQIFEPTFEMLKRIKKAEALSKGHHASSSTQDQYKERMIKRSRQHYLGVKQDA